MKKHAILWGLIPLAVVSIAIPAVAGDSTNIAPVVPTVSATTAAPALPYGVTEVLKMYQGGIGKDVIIGYIDASSYSFHMSADGIIYLKNIGVPQEITAAMMRRDGELQKQGMLAAQAGPPPGYDQQAMMPPPGAQPPPQQVVTPNSPPPDVSPYPYTDVGPAPATTVVVPGYTDPYWGYGYPYYYGYGPGIGWGWGRGGWGWRGGGYGGFRGGGGFHGGGHR